MKTTTTTGMTLFPKILFSILLVILVPLAGLLYQSIFQFQAELERKVNQDLKSTSETLAAKINGWTDMSVRLLKQNAALPEVRSYNEAQQAPILASILDTYEWTYLVYAIGPDGYKTARSDNDPVLNADGTPKHFRGDRTYFQQIKAGNAIGQQVLLSRTLGKPAFILCHTVGIQSSPGALCMGMKLTDMSEAVANISFGQSGYAMLLDDDNKVIAHGKPELLSEQLQDFSDYPMVANGTLEQPVVYSNNGVEKVAYMQPLNQGWRLIIEQDYDDAYASVKRTKLEAYILMIATLIISVLAAYLIARLITRPIAKLTAIAEDISKGKFHDKLDESARGDEIGTLARSIERMGVSIKIMLKRLAKKS
ncbi:cache domain-containing protein [Neptunomonas sp.]|uniref:PDC sensor domain-containing protein n=1 Tax=Neptunomonas TaxID=75687 RepID=UPI0035168330